MIRFFHSPGSCSEGILLLLEETGADFTIEKIDLKTRDQRSPQYLAVNPKGKVPAILREDGSLLTEFPAIAFWLAKTYPEARLMGEGTEAEARSLELMEFIVASLHMRAFTLLKVPQKFSAKPDVQSEIAAFGRSEAKSGLGLLSDILGDQDYLLGQFGVADAAAWYILRWAVAEEMTLPSNLLRLHARVSNKRSTNGQDAKGS